MSSVDPECFSASHDLVLYDLFYARVIRDSTKKRCLGDTFERNGAKISVPACPRMFKGLENVRSLHAGYLTY